MLDLISFLTQIPIKKAVRIDSVIEQSYLFPFVAALIGLVVAGIAFITFGALAATAELAAVLTVLALYLLTGLLHLDGLADFFDGLMTPGTVEDKRRAMKDNQLGIGGLFAVLAVLLVSIFAIAVIGARISGTVFDHPLASYYALAGLFVVTEVSAKLSMLTCMALGRSRGFVTVEGLGALFVRALTPQKYLAALISAVIIAIIFVTSVWCVMVLTGIVVAVVVAQVARLKFGAVSGDVLGTANELARCVTLFLWALLWVA
ncbi:MAG: adenosylcobinamide-GDP ribazoletransferase [Candidatus Methanospirareceae archaeon]